MDNRAAVSRMERGEQELVRNEGNSDGHSGVTTGIFTLFDCANEKVPVKKSYPIVGGIVDGVEAMQNDCVKLWKCLIGLNRYFDCLTKADIVCAYLRNKTKFNWELVMGSLLIWDVSMESNYGYYYNPPLEFHAWVELEGIIIDFALPGVIEAALQMKDKHGPLVTNREPCILFGVPEKWMAYKKEEVLYGASTNLEI